MACPYYPLENGYLQNILAAIDCQARTLGADGYLALATPGSVASLSLTAMLTIFVALIGYRMLFGEVPGVRGGVLALVKIGVVLALATGWQTYRTLAYDMVFYAPAQLASVIGASSGLPGSDGGLGTRLEGVNAGFEALAIEGTGPLPDPAVQPVPPPLFNGFDTFAIGGARVIYLIQVVGTFAGLQLLAGLMLALGPFFIGFLLFDATRGLFVGWLRALVGVVLGTLGVMLVLGMELALFEPWLTDLLAQRAAEQSISEAPAQLLATTIVFGFALAAIVGGAAFVARGLSLPNAVSQRLHERFALRENSERITASVQRSGITAPAEHSRAAAIVDAVASAQRREGARAMPAGSVAASIAPARPETVYTGTAVPLAAGSPRRPGSRVSATARRRDGTR